MKKASSDPARVTPTSDAVAPEPPSVGQIEAQKLDPGQAARAHLEACAAHVERAEGLCGNGAVTSKLGLFLGYRTYDATTAQHPACRGETQLAGRHLDAALDHITWLRGKDVAEACRSKFWHTIDAVSKAESARSNLRDQYLRAKYGTAIIPGHDPRLVKRLLRDLRLSILRWESHLPAVDSGKGKTGRPRKETGQVALARLEILTAKTPLSQKQIAQAVGKTSGRKVANIRAVMADVLRRFGNEIENVEDGEGDTLYRRRPPEK